MGIRGENIHAVDYKISNATNETTTDLHPYCINLERITTWKQLHNTPRQKEDYIASITLSDMNTLILLAYI